jgi:hypothetical protein
VVEEYLLQRLAFVMPKMPLKTPFWTPKKALFQHETEEREGRQQRSKERGKYEGEEKAAAGTAAPATKFHPYDGAALVAMLGAFCFCASSEWNSLVQVIAPAVCQLNQSAIHHEKDTKKAEKLHEKEMKQAQRHQLRELKNEMKNHIEQVAVDLREASKEADRDNWEQRHSMFETLITSAAVMLGGSCSVIVEGLSSLTDQAKIDEGHLIDNELFQIYFCFLLGCAYGFLFMCILLAMVVVMRMSEFMHQKADTQRSVIGKIYAKHRDLQTKWKELQVMHEQTSIVQGEHLLDILGGARANPDEDEGFGGAETILKGEADRQSRERFEKASKKVKGVADDWRALHDMMTEQVCVTTGHEPQHAFVHFGEYYKANCQLLGESCRMCFILGITSMLVVLIMIFMANFDDGQEPDSVIGKWLFCGVLLSISSLAIFVYILNWSTGSTGDYLGRMPIEHETFTFKPKDLLKRATEVFRHIDKDENKYISFEEIDQLFGGQVREDEKAGSINPLSGMKLPLRSYTPAAGWSDSQSARTPPHSSRTPMAASANDVTVEKGLPLDPDGRAVRNEFNGTTEPRTRFAARLSSVDKVGENADVADSLTDDEWEYRGSEPQDGGRGLPAEVVEREKMLRGQERDLREKQMDQVLYKMLHKMVVQQWGDDPDKAKRDKANKVANWLTRHNWRRGSRGGDSSSSGEQDRPRTRRLGLRGRMRTQSSIGSAIAGVRRGQQWTGISSPRWNAEIMNGVWD